MFMDCHVGGEGGLGVGGIVHPQSQDEGEAANPRRPMPKGFQHGPLGFEVQRSTPEPRHPPIHNRHIETGGVLTYRSGTVVHIQGDSKNMSPLAFKSNNSRPMSRTTLPDTAFERTDNFPSNECIHTRFPFQIASSQAANQKSSGFCVFRFQMDFDEREHFVLSPLYRNIAFI